MITPRFLATQVRNLLSLLLEAEIAVVINPVVEQHLGSSRRVTWQSPLVAATSLQGFSFATVGEYSHFIGSQMYSAVLFDGALLQISYDFVGRDIVGHRLCYYPCPFDVDENLLREEPLADVIDVYKQSYTSDANLRSPCRFDFDEQSTAPMHPTVHLHIIRPHCRWAVTTPLSIGDFIDFIFRHFYPQIWTVHPFLKSWPKERIGRRTISKTEEIDMHISCGQKLIPTLHKA